MAMQTIITDQNGEIVSQVLLPAIIPLGSALLRARGASAVVGETLSLSSIILMQANPNLDSDGDSVADVCDLCPNTVDLTNADLDLDGIGDVCDLCPTDPSNDADGDGICGSIDACPLDALNDADNDGICAERDNCPALANAAQADADFDGIGDVCDACPNSASGQCLFENGFESGGASAPLLAPQSLGVTAGNE